MQLFCKCKTYPQTRLTDSLDSRLTHYLHKFNIYVILAKPNRAGGLLKMSGKVARKAAELNDWRPVRVFYVEKFNLVFFEIAREGGRVQHFRTKINPDGDASEITELPSSSAEALEKRWSGTAAEIRDGDIYRAVLCFCKMQDLLRK